MSIEGEGMDAEAMRATPVVITPYGETVSYLAGQPPRQQGAVAQPLAKQMAEGQGLADGRVARSGVAGTEMYEQEPWGFGLVPARSRLGPTEALTLLPTDPVGYSVRQQDAVRRDLGSELGSYLHYTPLPFVGTMPLDGRGLRAYDVEVMADQQGLGQRKEQDHGRVS